KTERESKSIIGSGDRPARERAYRHRSPSSHRYSPRFSLCSRLLSPPPCLSSGTRPPVADLFLASLFGYLVLPLGGRGSPSSVDAGSCLREVEASSALPSSV
ncbi:unnamed protein product, partial [Brassica rapa]